MNKLLSIAALFTVTQGCVVHSYDYDDPEVVVIDRNRAPVILEAEAGVFFDAAFNDDIWYFDAAVDDGDGPLDVSSVWADIYDEGRGGVFVTSVELLPTNDPYIWYSEFYGRTMPLDPFYRGYTVDIIAYDSYDATDFITISPYVY